MSILKRLCFPVIFSCLLILCCSLSACPSCKKDATQLAALYERYFDFNLTEYPELATILGYEEHNGSWSNLSEEQVTKRQEIIVEMLGQLKAISQEWLTDDEKLNYALLQNLLQDSVNWIPFKREYMPINKLDGTHIVIGMILDAMPTNEVEDFDHLIERLTRVYLVIEDTIEMLKKGVASGIVPPKITVDDVPSQLVNLITENPEDSYYFAPFKKIPASFSTEEKERIVRQAKQMLEWYVFPSLRKLNNYLTREYIPACRDTVSVSDLPNGKEWYLQSICSFTTTQLTPEEIHQMGVKEVARIRGEMEGVLNTLNYSQSLEDFFEYLRTDPQFFYTSTDELMKEYEEILKRIEGKLPILFGRLPTIPCTIVPIPDSSAKDATAAYYMEGSIKANRPGRFFVNTSDLSSRPKWEMDALALHEALPGHHMQISIALENQNLPRFRRICFFTAYIEGWGLYAEGLGKELDVYRDSYSWFGRLNMEIFRAARLVVDTGIHAMGWSRQDAIDYLDANTSLLQHEIENEVDRYITWPGQALAYKIGEKKILELRHLAEKELGEHFDIRAFHDVLLQNGALPLTLLEAHLKQWIDSRKPAPVSVPLPATVPENAPVPEKAPEPVPESVPVPEKAPAPVPLPATVPENAPLPEKVPVPEKAPEPENAPDSESATEPAPENEPVPDSSPEEGAAKNLKKDEKGPDTSTEDEQGLEDEQDSDTGTD